MAGFNSDIPNKAENSNNKRNKKRRMIKMKRILIVDDILYIVKSLSNILKDEGYSIITAMSGAEALTRLEKYSPDLITIDQNLPDMTGINLVKKIRENEKYKDLKIIFISAVYERDKIKMILQLGIDNYLMKPFKKKKLIETIEKLLGD